MGSITPADLAGLSLWMDANDTTTINAKLAAQFTAANSEYLSSSNAVFNVGDEDFSFGGWFYPTTLGISNPLFGRWITSTNNRSFLLFVNTTNIPRCLISSTGTGVTTQFVDSTVTLSINTWYFCVFVYDSAANLLKISINNETFVTAAHSGGAYAASTSPLRFGLGNFSGIDNYSDCRQDSCFFYKKALTQAQVTALYNSGNGVAYENLTADQLTNLTAWWSLNERSGNRADEHGGYTLTDNNTVTYGLGKVQEPIEPDEYVWSWVDKSSNAFVFSQDTAASQPQWKDSGFGVNSMPYIQFNGTTNNLALTIANIFSGHSQGTMFLVYSSGAVNTPQYILTSSDTAGLFNYLMFRTRASGSNNYTAVSNADGVTVSLIYGDDYTDANNTPIQYNVKSTGIANPYVMRRNQQLQTLTASSGSNLGAWFADITGRDNIVIGGWISTAPSNSNLRIAEIIYTSEALSNTKIYQIERYIKNKYGTF